MKKKYTLEDLVKHSQWLKNYISNKIKKTKRNDKKNYFEYNNVKFLKILNKIKKTKIKKYKDFYNILTIKNKKILCLDGSKYKIFKDNEYFIKNIKLVNYYLNPYINKKTNIVELGAGFGRISFSLISQKKYSKNKLICYEYTKNGREILKNIRSKINLNVLIYKCNFNAKNILEKNPPYNSLIFTYNSLMLIPKIKERFIKYIIKLKPKAVVHFEPNYSSLGQNSLLDYLSRDYCNFNDYNTNLFIILKKFEKNNKIKILKKSNNFLRRNPLLPSSVLIWKPI